MKCTMADVAVVAENGMARKTGIWLSAWIIAAIVMVWLTTTAQAVTFPAVTPVVSCEQLGKQAFSAQVGEKVTINSASTLTTDKGTFCKISATIAPSIGVEVALPTEHWTQRFLQVGCGGLCGNINMQLSNASSCVPALNGEFTVAATDMGHSGSMMDATWAENPQKRIDFAYRANHLTAVLSKALSSAYYGQPPKYAYFMGCSDGGREALVEAQRYPSDFNGISAGAPAAFFSFQNSFFHGWTVVANQRADGSSILLQKHLPILHAAVMAHCPTLSGVKDGILQNPYACHFSDRWVKQCAKGDNDQKDCITKEQLHVADILYEGASDAKGRHFVLGGLPLGSELRWAVPDTAEGTSSAESMVLPALQSILLADAKQNIASMKDFPLDVAHFKQIAQLAPLYNAANTDLRLFNQRGGKLIMWHGLGDDSVSPAFSLAYYRGVRAYMGEKATVSMLRLFLLPGVGHCGNGDGYDQIDLLTPLMAWTEDGQAPNKLIAGKRDVATAPAIPMGPPKADGDKSSAEAQFHGVQKPRSPVAAPAANVTATRPVFPYPYIARYTGKGDVNDASNYRAVKSQSFDKIVFGQPAASYVGPDNQHDFDVEDGRLIQK